MLFEKLLSFIFLICSVLENICINIDFINFVKFRF